MPPPRSARRGAKPKKSGFWRGVFLLALGFTGGAGASAYFAAYINKLPLPLGETPTRAANNASGEELQDRARRETLEFHETLRQRRAAPAANESVATPPDAAEEPTAARRELYYLQAGAFAERETAEQLRGEIALLGEQASIRADGGGNLFRVWLGPYPSKNAAEESRANLALQGYNQVQLLKTLGDNP